MKVVVAALSDFCPAMEALRSEGVAPRLTIVKGQYDYGRALAQAWEEGEEFINLEHDVVPWPGALKNLIGCESVWCGYQYIAGHSARIRRPIQTGIGCVRFSEQVIRKTPSLVEKLRDVVWQAIEPTIWQAIGSEWHCHLPPVAHLSAMKTLQ